jgi:hypothetical protein
MKKSRRKPRVSLETVVAILSAECVKGDSTKRKRIELLGAMLWRCGERFRRNRAGWFPGAVPAVISRPPKAPKRPRGWRRGKLVQ